MGYSDLRNTRKDTWRPTPTSTRTLEVPLGHPEVAPGRRRRFLDSRAAEETNDALLAIPPAAEKMAGKMINGTGQPNLIEYLMFHHGIDIPFVTISGRLRGSAMTSSALNALAAEAE